MLIAGIDLLSASAQSIRDKGLQIMSVEIIAPSLATSARPIRISIPKPVPAFDRRRRPWRAEDRTQLTSAELARWFIERESQPHIVVDQQMNVLLKNRAATSYLRRNWK